MSARPPSGAGEGEGEQSRDTPTTSPQTSPASDSDDTGFHFGLLHGGVALAGVLLMNGAGAGRPRRRPVDGARLGIAWWACRFR